MLGKQQMDTKGFYALSLIAGTSIAVYYIWMKNKRTPKPKGEWKQVGSVANLYIYPLKSSRYKPLNKAEVTGKGLKEIRDDGLLPLCDRVFVIFRSDNGEFLTGRTYPKLIGIIVTSVSEDSVKFSFNGVEPLIVKIPNESKNEVKMWENEKVPTADCGDEASKWISNLLQVEKPVRMGYWSQSINKRRDISNYQSEKSKFYDIRPEHTGAYSDMSGFLLINESSVKDVIPRLTPGSTPISHKNFRPNIVIDGPKEYEEDNWKWVKIGENAIFKVVSPCTRCSFTTINPDTLIRDKNLEPIKTLKTYRQAKEEKAKKIDGTSPYMGINLGLYQAGIIATGDLVYVLDK